MRLDLVRGELNQVESMWGRTRWGQTCHGTKPAATITTDYSNQDFTGFQTGLIY